MMKKIKRDEAVTITDIEFMVEENKVFGMVTFENLIEKILDSKILDEEDREVR